MTSSLAASALACALFASIASTPAAFAGHPAASVSKKKLEWRVDLPTALDDAAKQNKTVLLRFTAAWCGPCRVMDARVWTDSSVQNELAGNQAGDQIDVLLIMLPLRTDHGVLTPWTVRV